jgi:hypothetical protein
MTSVRDEASSTSKSNMYQRQPVLVFSMTRPDYDSEGDLERQLLISAPAMQQRLGLQGQQAAIYFN